MHVCSMFLGIKNCGFSKLWVLKMYVRVFKILGTQNCGYLVDGSSKILCGYSKYKFVCAKICGYLKFVGTCTQYLNFVGTQICGC